jgi:predicted PurR-regulated permease PerM
MNPAEPIVEKSGESRGRLRTVGTGIIAFVALCAAFYFAREFFIPVVFAILLEAIFRPVVRTLEKIHVPTTAGAAAVVLSLIVLFGIVGFAISGSAQNWLEQLPRQFTAAKGKVDKFRKPLERLSRAANELENATKVPTTAPAEASANDIPPATSPAPAPAIGSGLAARFLGGTFQILTTFLEILLLLFLLLASGDLFMQKLVKIIPLWSDKKAAVQVVNESQSIVMGYILINAIIMACQGVVVALVLWPLGMPSPWIWGILTFLLELIPYLGAATMIILLTIGSFATFNGVGHALLVPASYAVITVVQSSVISPIVYGKRLRLNPVAVFVGVLFWFFLWGVPGAYLSVPIIATTKILADRSESFKALGEFLGE